MPSLPQFLTELERRGVGAISHNHWLAPTDELMLDEMDSIGITHAFALLRTILRQSLSHDARHWRLC